MHLFLLYCYSIIKIKYLKTDAFNSAFYTRLSRRTKLKLIILITCITIGMINFHFLVFLSVNQFENLPSSNGLNSTEATFVKSIESNPVRKRLQLKLNFAWLAYLTQNKQLNVKAYVTSPSQIKAFLCYPSSKTIYFHFLDKVCWCQFY